MAKYHRSSVAAAALATLCALGMPGSIAEPVAGAGKPADLPCPTVAIGPDVKIVELTSAGQGADGQSPVVPEFTTSRCSDMCDVASLLKTVEIDDPGDVFLVLVTTGRDNAHLFWKPVAAQGTRIVGALTFGSSVKVYRPPGILSATQLSPVSQLSGAELNAACGLKFTSRGWTDDAIRAVTGRGPDRAFHAVAGRRPDILHPWPQ
jgi:hypothetical protein